MKATFQEPSKLRGFVPARRQLVGGLDVKNVSMDQMDSLGIGFLKTRRHNALREMYESYAGDERGWGMDAGLQPAITPANIPTPIQFLQNWLPGLVKVNTDARNIDLLVGKMVAGAWEDEQVVQGLLERLGTAVEYGDLTNVPLASWDVEWNTRTNVRFELGMQVGALEEARNARAQIDSAGMKRNSAQWQLEIVRNMVGFYGFNNGANETYGFLNDPGLPAYQSVANGNWGTATLLEIIADLLTAIQTLRTQSGGTIDPKRVRCTLAISTNTVDYLSTPSDLGYSVLDWLKDNYPMIRVQDAPELDGANGGLNVFYLYADEVQDGSTDDNKTFIQVVPATFMVLGVEKKAKGFIEDYSNATAGIMLKRPYAVTRWSGI